MKRIIIMLAILSIANGIVYADGGENYLPPSKRNNSIGFFERIFSSSQPEYYKPPERRAGYRGNIGPKGPPQDIPLDGGELVFIFMGILYWIRERANSNTPHEYEILNISRREYRNYVLLMLFFVEVFMPIGALSSTIYIDMNIVALVWLLIIVSMRLYTMGMLNKLNKLYKKLKKTTHEKNPNFFASLKFWSSSNN